MRNAALILILLITFPTQAWPGINETIAQLEQAWAVWARSNRVRKGAIVISLNGNPVYQSTIGTDVNNFIELASLSKSITAVCIDVLVRQGLLNYNMRLEDVLEVPFADPDLAKATIGQLITHSAGIAPDSTQHSMGRWIGTSIARHDTVSTTVIERRNQRGTLGHYFYNNENYALLGTIVETITGRNYADICGQLATNGQARLSPTTGGFAPWGGWMMTLQEYAKFSARNFGSHRPNQSVSVSLGGGAYYGLGTIWRQARVKYNYWHFGRHCFPGKLNAGSFSVSWQGEWAVVVAYDICASDRQNNELDAAFVEVVFN